MTKRSPLIVTASRTLTRRRFLQSTAVAGGAMALGWPRRAWGQLLLEPDLTRLPDSTPVDHVVVLMNENRSFDHYFGWLTGTNQQTYTGIYDDLTQPLNGQTRSTHHHAPDYRGCDFVDPSHSWTGGRAQLRNETFLTGSNTDEFAIGFYLESDVEFYGKLARQFTLCDNYFCSLLGPTFPNREYMHSAQSGGLKNNALPPEAGFPTGFPWLTIWDRLEAAGISWAYYFVDLPAILLWGSRLAKGLRHTEDFFADALAGTLPNVVFVDPGFTTGLRTDEHPHGDVRAGQAFAHNVVKAVVESPLWPRMAMFLNYDEWGGFFDHVRPGRMPDDRATDGDPGGDNDFGQLGFRVACAVISPYARKGLLATEILGLKSPKNPPPPKAFTKTPARFYDHTSILKFIEWRFGLAPLTARDAAAANIGLELLDFDQAPRLDVAEIVEALPRPVVTSEPCPGEELEGTGVDGPLEDALEQIGDAFQHALESGYFESVGWDGQLPTLDSVLGG